MASTSARFVLAKLIVNGNVLSPDDSGCIPSSESGYNVTLNGNILQLKSPTGVTEKVTFDNEEYVRLFSPHQPPTGVRSWGLTALASVRVTDPLTHESKFLVIRRSTKLSTFPGMMACPGGFIDPGETSLLDTASRELGEEVGMGWFDYVNALAPPRHCAIIESVPSVNIKGVESFRHNISVIVHFELEMKEDVTFDQLKDHFSLQEGEVDDAGLWTRAGTPSCEKFARSVLGIYSVSPTRIA